MAASERLRRLLFFSSLVLVIAAAPLLWVSVPLGAAVVVLAGIIFWLARLINATPRRSIERADRDEERVSAAASAAPLRQRAEEEQEDREEQDDVPAAASAVRPEHPTVARRLVVPLWVWLAGALLLGIAAGIALDQWLPEQQFDVATLESVGSSPAQSPLASPFDPSAAGMTAAESSLIEAQVRVSAQIVTVRHAELDIGRPDNIFDGDPATLMRGKSANPFIFEVHYAMPLTATAVILHLARMSDFQVTLIAFTADGRSLRFSREYAEELIDPVLTFEVPGGAQRLRAVRVAILDRRAPPAEGFHTHVREFRLIESPTGSPAGMPGVQRSRQPVAMHLG